MKLEGENPTQQQSGFAMVMVMVIIMILGGLAAEFSTSMRIELKLAQNSSWKHEIEWIGRSGVEYAKWALSLHAESRFNDEPFDALHQIWAGGPGSEFQDIDPALLSIQLKNHPIGNGEFSITIEDTERWFNINLLASGDPAMEDVFKNALDVMGVSYADTSAIMDSIADWVDPDDNTRASGAETQDYMYYDPPYMAKNGPIDDIRELLLIQGVTPELYWGNEFNVSKLNLPPEEMAFAMEDPMAYQPIYPIGLKDILTPISIGQINVNTASRWVLQLVPGIDELTANAIIERRSGADFIEGTGDDEPFRSPAEVPMGAGGAEMSQNFFTVRSVYFLVTVDASVDNTQKTYEALVQRQSAQNIQTLFMREI